MALVILWKCVDYHHKDTTPFVRNQATLIQNYSNMQMKNYKDGLLVLDPTIGLDSSNKSKLFSKGEGIG